MKRAKYLKKSSIFLYLLESTQLTYKRVIVKFFIIIIIINNNIITMIIIMTIYLTTYAFLLKR